MTPRIIAANLVVRLRSLGREKSAIFFTLAFPVILVLVFGAIFTRPERAHFDLPVQDLDQTALSAQFIGSLSADDIFNTKTLPPDTDAVTYATRHKLNFVLIIPKGFAAAPSRKTPNTTDDARGILTYVYDPSSTSVSTKLQYLTAIVTATNHKLSGTPPLITMKAQSILTRQYRFIEFFVPGIIAMAVMTSSVSGALHVNAELRQKGILRKLTTTPITRTDWLLSNILYQLILAVASTASILLVAYAVFDVRLQVNAWLPLFIVLEVFAFVGVGMVLTPLAKDAESAAAAANAFLFPMMFLSGTFFPIEMMPGFLQTVAKVLPLYYVNEGMRAFMIFDDGAGALKCAAITAGVAAVLFVAGAGVTRWSREA